MMRMRHLHLLRHAKSSWDDPALDDHERPLAPRGRKAAERIAEHARTAGMALLPVLGGDVEIRLEDALYGAGPEEVLARVRVIDDRVSSALVLGHNPTLHELALLLSGRSDALDRFPTGALASLAFPNAWASLSEGGAELEDVAFPREL